MLFDLLDSAEFRVTVRLAVQVRVSFAPVTSLHSSIHHGFLTQNGMDPENATGCRKAVRAFCWLWKFT